MKATIYHNGTVYYEVIYGPNVSVMFVEEILVSGHLFENH